MPGTGAQTYPGPQALETQGVRQAPLEHNNPARQIANVPVEEHGSSCSAISSLHPQMPPPV